MDVPKFAARRSALVARSDTASASSVCPQWIVPADIDTLRIFVPTNSVSIAVPAGGAASVTSSDPAPASRFKVPFQAATSSRSPATPPAPDAVRTEIEALPLAWKASTPAPRSTYSEPPTAAGLNDPVTPPPGRRIGSGSPPEVTVAGPSALTAIRSLPEVP